MQKCRMTYYQKNSSVIYTKQSFVYALKSMSCECEVKAVIFHWNNKITSLSRHITVFTCIISENTHLLPLLIYIYIYIKLGLFIGDFKHPIGV